MSLLADRRKNTEDYPDAARKHLEDATALQAAKRHDGCLYLSGYVVECALKSVFLHEASWDPTSRTYLTRKLNAELDRLQVPNHNLGNLHEELTRVTASATALSAKYVPPPPPTPPPRWNASLRYRAPCVAERDSVAMLAEAKRVFEHTIVRMRLDGVL